MTEEQIENEMMHKILRVLGESQQPTDLSINALIKATSAYILCSCDRNGKKALKIADVFDKTLKGAIKMYAARLKEAEH